MENFKMFKNFKSILSEPYRLFFPLGFLLGLWGVLLWTLFVLFKTPYPGVMHSYLMIGGFLTAFTTGFLMTAVPRFTGTFHAELYEIIIAAISLLALPILVIHSAWAASVGVVVCHLNLMIFFARRFQKRKVPLPEQFLFIPASLLVSLFGHLLVILSSLSLIGAEHLALGRLLAFYAFMLGVVLGVGSKLIPAFTGFGPFKAKAGWRMYLMMVVFYSSFLVQHWLDVRLGLWMRLSAIVYVAMIIWSVHRRPMNPSKLSYGLWLSCWGVLIGALGGALFPSSLVQWNHILFIFGFGLMTLMIGSRVILSHGGFDLQREGEHPWISVIIAMLVMTSLVRLSLLVKPSLYSSLTFVSAVLWIVSLLIWWKHIGIKARSTSAQKSASSC
jgi:uncharacterized protein involved in response to NO